MKDGRTSLKMEGDTFRRVQSLASETDRSLNGMLEVLITDAIGKLGKYPCIVKSAGEYIWVSPFGTFGTLDRSLWGRFVSSGCVPLNSVNRWDDSFDSMSEACFAFGTPICRWTTNGLNVLQLDGFRELDDIMTAGEQISKERPYNPWACFDE